MKRFFITIFSLLLLLGVGLYLMVEGLPKQLEEESYKLHIPKTDLANLDQIPNLSMLVVFDHDEVTTLKHDGELVWEMVQETRYHGMTQDDMDQMIDKFYSDVDPLLQDDAGQVVEMKAEHRVEDGVLITALYTDLKRVNRGFAPDYFEFEMGDGQTVLNKDGNVSLDLYVQALENLGFEKIQ